MSSSAASLTDLAGPVQAKAPDAPLPAANRNLTEDDIRALADLAANLQGAWRCNIRRDEHGDIEAVITRSGFRRSTNAFVVKRNGSKVSLIATHWPFRPATLATYASTASLVSYLGNAIGHRR
jgi:hypothetical protein